MSSDGGSGNISDSERFTRLGDEIEALVARGAENTRFEFTRQCSLAANDRKSQVDFAKTIQGMANCLPPEDRGYVIGADQKKKCFLSLENAREFDTANLGQILSKYLDPVPDFASYPLVSKSGQNYIAVFVPAEQPRPIVAKTSVQATDGRNELLRAGDVWIKKNTALMMASRGDIEAMYAVRIEAEAERRAQQRFAITRDTLEATLRIRTGSEPQTPTEDLILGPDSNYEAYVEQIIASHDELRFRMLLTVVRRLLIERWHTFRAYGSYLSEPSVEIVENLGPHVIDIFQPSLRRLVHAGLLLLEYDTTPIHWFENVARLLVAAFVACTKLEALSEDSRKNIGIEIAIAAKVLGSYAARMNRYSYLPALLREAVQSIGRTKRNRKEPIMFWPVRRNVPGNDRIAYAWERAVKPYGLRFFGSDKSFLDSASVLEFVILLNSDLATTVPEAAQWLADHYPYLDMTYSADLWRYRIESCVPLAEQIFEALASGPDMPAILNISVVHGVFQAAFPREWKPEQRQARFIEWLRQMDEWREQAAVSTQGFAHAVDWGPIISPALYKDS